MLFLACGVTMGDPSRLVEPSLILRSCVSSTSMSPLRFSAIDVILEMVRITASTVGMLLLPLPDELDTAAILVLKQMGLIFNLAALESGKAKRCMSATAN